MKILGIHSITHDVSAALCENGIITHAVEEEKLSRIKHHPGIQFGGGPPIKSIEYLLRKLKKGIGDVDLIVHVGWPGSDKEPLDFMRKTYRDFANKLDNGLKKTIFVDHHLSHAAAAYYGSGFGDSIILVVDGHGDYIATSIYLARESDIEFKKVAEYFVDQSLGMMYTRAAKTIGLGDLGYGEGKMSALAAYGNTLKILPLVDFNDERYILKDYFKFFSKFKRDPKDNILKKHIDFAATIQDTLERSVIYILTKTYKKYGIKNVCLSGGVGLNCAMNGKIRTLPWIGNFFVFPAANDSGLSIGAAYLGALNKGDKVHMIKSMCLGPNLNQKEIKHFLDNNFINSIKVTSYKKAAECLSTRRIVAWAQGNIEFGPRALGHRSLLGYPRNIEVKDRLNNIKKRDIWRPVCPSIINDKYFSGETSSLKYMTVAVKVNDIAKKEISAGIHIDGTSRVQLVADKKDSYYKLIKHFNKITSVPAVLNTSLNTNDEPLCSSISDVIKFFYTTPTDDLFIGNYWVTKRNFF